MDYFTTTSAASRRAASAIVVGIYDRNKLSQAAAEIDKASDGLLSKLLKSGSISSKLGKASVHHSLQGTRAQRVVTVGLGKADEFGVAALRKATAAAMTALDSHKITELVSYLTLEPAGKASPYYLARHTVQTIGDALYRFEMMKSTRRSPAPTLKKVGLAVEKRADSAQATLGAEHADAIVKSMSLAKDLGNLPPNVCTPTYLARTAQKLAKEHARFDTKIVNETEMKKLGMHSLLSVTAGTEEPAKLIVMQYKGNGKAAPVVLVGKGITFDSGGISIKPGPGMDEMKYDMCGAASVIATMAAVATLQLPINVTAVVPACENLPSGKATKPGDIVKSMSGQTIEILNTDAEGRLILCDALTYARRFKPAVTIDVATLTGACVIALGHHTSAVMSNNDALANELVASGVSAEDRAWQLPMADEYTQQLKSNFADMANVGGREGGAITAACFLSKFTDGMNWAHMDIAGTAWQTGSRKGGTGRPVPLLTQFLLARAAVLP
ncbi:leucyl aminopeptidase [Woeseia oceani]|uniref:Probable cytosol aminopeptidase n=1 Tax=Woeseia oceani TaxID=1548547 RepID=A0A193LGM3_9GAMM|nr:leucyl aminopeptidase [Woeseia oceani]ANO51662.1 leucyl aminopeptidase [Woeseia oceani]